MSETLRRLADEGRVVVVATTAPTNLDALRPVLVLTADGHSGVRRGTLADRHAAGFDRLGGNPQRVRADPYGAHDEYLARNKMHRPRTRSH